jgi:hypothetical protein
MWTWDGRFRASKLNPDGTITEKVFSSVAQARQHVEKHEKRILASKVKPPRHMTRHRVRIKGSSTPLTRLNKEQRRLKQEAMKQFKGL